MSQHAETWPEQASPAATSYSMH